jgi:hypothetical protein
MTQQDLNFGTAAANDGETLATAFLKIQENFDDLYASVATDVAALAAHIADTGDAHDASAVSFADSGNDYAATEVEAALTEVMDAHLAHLADAADAHDASAISVAPTGTLVADDVQEALVEILGDIETHVADATAAHAASAISVSPSGSLVADDVQEALLEILGDIETHVADGSAAHAASAISYNGGTGMSATDVEAAIDELATEKLDIDDARERLTAARTYYVATTGSDSNDGLTALTPFLTGQKAADVIRDNLDLAGYTVTVQFADGTYTDAILCNRAWTGQGTGQVIFQGNTSTPANVIFSTTSANAISAVRGARISITGMELRTTTSGYCLDAGAAGAIGVLTAVRFGTAASGHVVSDSAGLVLLNNSYSIVGAAPFHILVFSGGHVESLSVTVTITGTPAFSTAYAQVFRGGSATLSGNTYSGSATGVRFIVGSGGSIMTSDAGLTALPGDAAGLFQGGFYDKHMGSVSASVDGGTFVFNDAGGDFDFRAEGDTDANLLFLDASTDRVGIGTSSPGAKLDMRGSAIFNEDGSDADFRIEGDTEANLFLLDASVDSIALGHSAAIAIGGVYPRIAAHGTGSTSRHIQSLRWSADVNGGFVYVGKSRGAAIGTRGAVASGDVLGILSFAGDDATDFIRAAEVAGQVEGTVSTNVVPAGLYFSSTDDSGVRTTAMRVTKLGNTLVAKGIAALATSATDGFLYVPSCAGTPTGVPTTYTGLVPVIVDTTNHRWYFYSGGSWRNAGP